MKYILMSTLIRYIIIAGLVYVIDMGGYYYLIELGQKPVISNIIVKVVAVICGFFMHRRFTYQIRGPAEALAHAKKYFGLAFIYTPISSMVLYLLMFIIPSPLYAKAGSDILLFILSFWVTTKFTFTKAALSDSGC
jgi:putative flippase GtrA